ncbi:DUF3892 domain-containing protein [Aeromicrobium sp. 179-A 4D2 NHS]|uniref:DUF3892 domain-containing protein n=1 Tax=Aeromicrobium sp. 179-A 4D2 NHS TaxID=3142375 RepID=UPI0039A182C4
MTELRVITHVTKDERDNIIEVGNEGLWREPVEKVIDDMTSVAPSFEYRVQGPGVDGSSAVSVVNSRHGRYLRTHADRRRGNNLDELPNF